LVALNFSGVVAPLVACAAVDLNDHHYLTFHEAIIIISSSSSSSISEDGAMTALS